MGEEKNKTNQKHKNNLKKIQFKGSELFVN